MQEEAATLPVLIGQLFQIVRSLNRMYEEYDRPFTPDGHLVGSIGEVVAADTYGLILEKCSNEGFDAKTTMGQTVEIKLTGGTSVAVSSDAEPPTLLVVLHLDSKIGFTEVYNGVFPLDIWHKKKATKRRVKSFTVRELKHRNPKMLKQIHPLEILNKLFGPAKLT